MSNFFLLNQLKKKGSEEMNIQPISICRICKKEVKTDTLIYAIVKTETISGICRNCVALFPPELQQDFAIMIGIGKGIEKILETLSEMRNKLHNKTSCLVENAIQTLMNSLIMSNAFLKDRILENM